MPEIEFKCPKCGRVITVDSQSTGSVGQCPYCKAVVRSPRTGTVPMTVPDYATFGDRAAARILDAIIVMVPSFIISSLFSAGVESRMTDDISQFIGGQIAFKVMSIIVAWLYFATMESSKNQGTLGKMALGIRVVDINYARISFGQATGRYVGSIISAITLGVGFLIQPFTKKKQTLHDMMASCLVVKGEVVRSRGTGQRQTLQEPQRATSAPSAKAIEKTPALPKLESEADMLINSLEQQYNELLNQVGTYFPNSPLPNDVDKKIHALAYEEITSKRLDPATHTKAFSSALGDETKHEAFYVKYRAIGILRELLGNKGFLSQMNAAEQLHTAILKRDYEKAASLYYSIKLTGMPTLFEQIFQDTFSFLKLDQKTIFEHLLRNYWAVYSDTCNKGNFLYAASCRSQIEKLCSFANVAPDTASLDKLSTLCKRKRNMRRVIKGVVALFLAVASFLLYGHLMRVRAEREAAWKVETEAAQARSAREIMERDRKRMKDDIIDASNIGEKISTMSLFEMKSKKEALEKVMRSTLFSQADADTKNKATLALKNIDNSIAEREGYERKEEERKRAAEEQAIADTLRKQKEEEAHKLKEKQNQVRDLEYQRSKWRQLAVGMNQAQVLSILGSPVKTKGSSPFLFWYYKKAVLSESEVLLSRLGQETYLSVTFYNNTLDSWESP